MDLPYQENVKKGDGLNIFGRLSPVNEERLLREKRKKRKEKLISEAIQKFLTINKEKDKHHQQQQRKGDNAVMNETPKKSKEPKPKGVRSSLFTTPKEGHKIKRLFRNKVSSIEGIEEDVNKLSLMKRRTLIKRKKKEETAIKLAKMLSMYLKM
jgi:hypothetical protein